mmetsp:Transcript_13231/g.24429  ORF Transcript_13231/g.24429 Transcript_13231/m.24429 type:complete len:285 (+) Transcript_13231:49-903(+)
MALMTAEFFEQSFQDMERESVLHEVAKNGDALQHAPQHLRSDREVVLTAVMNAGIALAHASAALCMDKEIAMAAVQSHAGALCHVAEQLRNDKEVVLAAVAQDGASLVYAHNDLKQDREVALQAVAQQGSAICFVHNDLKADRELALAAARAPDFNLSYAAKSLQSDISFVKEVAALCPVALEFVDLSTFSDDDLQSVARCGQLYVLRISALSGRSWAFAYSYTMSAYSLDVILQCCEHLESGVEYRLFFQDSTAVPEDEPMSKWPGLEAGGVHMLTMVLSKQS